MILMREKKIKSKIDQCSSDDRKRFLDKIINEENSDIIRIKLTRTLRIIFETSIFR